jgi:hypothetical protein
MVSTLHNLLSFAAVAAFVVMICQLLTYAG